MKLILIIVAVIVASLLVWYKMYRKSPLEAAQAEWMKLFRAGDESGSLALMLKIKEKFGVAPFPVDLSVRPPNTEIMWKKCGDDKTLQQCFAAVSAQPKPELPATFSKI